jgi:hypothetical protein
VIVNYLDVFGVTSRPTKANAELIVHPQVPLASAIAAQLLEPVTRRRPEVLDTSRDIELLELAQCRALDIGKARYVSKPEQRFGVDTLEGRDRHCRNITA